MSVKRFLKNNCIICGNIEILLYHCDKKGSTSLSSHEGAYMAENPSASINLAMAPQNFPNNSSWSGSRAWQERTVRHGSALASSEASERAIIK